MFGGGMNPRKMQKMMKQMGIDMTELDAEEVVIRTSDEELVFTDAEVTRTQGSQTYQIAGEPESRERGAGEDEGAKEGDSEAVPDADVELVATRTGAGEAAAREALEAEDGDLAAAVSRLE